CPRIRIRDDTTKVLSASPAWFARTINIWTELDGGLAAGASTNQSHVATAGNCQVTARTPLINIGNAPPRQRSASDSGGESRQGGNSSCRERLSSIRTAIRAIPIVPVSGCSCQTGHTRQEITILIEKRSRRSSRVFPVDADIGITRRDIGHS